MEPSNWTPNKRPPVGWHGACTWGEKQHWVECVVLPRSHIAIFKFGKYSVIPVIDGLPSLEFRLLPTKEQLEREELANLITEAVGMGFNAERISDIVYAEGYRKQEQVQ